MLTITKLKIAVESNKVEQIKDSLRQYGLPKNGPKTTDYLLLKLAIRTNKTEIAKLLINAGCRVNRTPNDNDFTPLALAIQIENEELATLLLEKGTNLDAGNNIGSTVLHLAAEEKLVKMLNLLLRYQTNVNHIWNGKTPFQVFLESCYTDNNCASKHTDIIRLFLAKGATVNFKIHGKVSVLHLAVNLKQNDIIKRVLQATNNVDEQDNNQCTALHCLLRDSKTIENKIVDLVKCFMSKGAKINIQDYSGDTVCHLAAKNKYLQILQIFLHHAEIGNYWNKAGDTVLHCILMYSADFCNSAEYLEIVDLVIKQNPSWVLGENNNGQNALHIAAEYKQTQVLDKMLFDKPENINQPDHFGYSILFHFVIALVNNNFVPEKDDVKMIKKLLSMGADPAIYHPVTKRTPLNFALKLKHRKIILHMLKCNFDFDRFDRNHNRSILILLCTDELHCMNCDDNIKCAEMRKSLNAEIAEICIKRGANINIRDSDSRTPLYHAVLWRHKCMVKIFLEHGADYNLVDNKGITILEILMKDAEIIDEKLNTVKKVQRNIVRDSEIVQMLLFHGAIAENVSDGHVSIFHYCAINLHLDLLSEIISYSRDPNIPDIRKNTILHALLTYNSNKNKKVEVKVGEIVKILLSKGAKIEAVNYKGETPLHLAAKGKYFEISKVLIEHKAKVTDLDNSGNTVLHFLCMLKFETEDPVEQSLSELFLTKGCDINARNKKGMTPLLLAAQSGSISMIKILIKLNANFDCVENENSSMAIHLAAENNHPEVIQQLIDVGVDVNIRRGDSKTALHLSVAHNLTKATKVLLANRADTDLKDNEGKTSLHWACWYERFDNINTLLEYGADVNVEDNFRVTPIMLTRQSNNVWMNLCCHLIKLKFANMSVSDCNKTYIEKYYEEHRNNYNKEEIIIFEISAIRETMKMKKLSISPHISLADVLRMSTNKLSFFKK